ncbi:nitronate monooxygenase [Chitinophaga costaii]|nr:nitronate monooxygenase [Chitinophaga costaii]PUZ30618.1 nitronate monooxygenase [Chitinophaga costaii]
MSNTFTTAFGIRYPILMAPMFLVSNEAMVQAAMEQEIAGTFPSLNYRKDGELAAVLERLNARKAALDGRRGNYGVNLIVQRSNPLYEQHLQVCVAAKVPFYITSLGNPRQVIDAAHSYGAKVLCDVTNLQHAQKAASEGADGFIAVCAGAGGHAGPYPMQVLVPALRGAFPHLPVIAAGGIANGQQIASALVLDAAGVSIGTRFIASTEAGVSDAYKQGIVQYGMDDIVPTERLSGTPCNIINTPAAKQMGYRQNWLEKLLSRNAKTKRYFKMLVQLKGMKKLEKAVHPGAYQQLWTAGQSVEMIHDISSIAHIVHQLTAELETSQQQLYDLHF